MQFSLSEDQLAIQDMAARFCEDEIMPHAGDWDRARKMPLETLRHAASLGMGAICCKADHGGSDLTRLDATLIYEALAYGCPGFSAFVSIHNIVSKMLDRHGNDSQKAAWLPGLASCSLVGSYCLTEPGAGSDAAALKTTARRDGECFVLNGVKQFISGGGFSDLYIVMVRTGAAGPKGISAFMVEKGMQGLSFGTPERKMGWHVQPTAQVIFEDCRVPAENLIGSEGEGFTLAMEALDSARLNIGACSLGGGTRAADIANGYVRERMAFGKPLWEQQSVQFSLADLYTELDAARLMIWRGAYSLDHGQPNSVRHSAMAKRFATDVGFNAANRSLQLLGGYGYLEDYGIEKIVRDLRVHQILEGSNEIMRLIISRSL